MHTRTLFFVVALFPCCVPAFAQQIVDNICMQVIGANGLSAKKLGKHYDATLGEVITATLSASDGTFTITQGFHQPECALSVSVNDLHAALPWQLEVFPNPTASLLHLRYTLPSSGLLEARLWSITGELVADWKTVPESAELDCSALPSGVYLLDLRDQRHTQNSVVRFVKSNN